MLAASAVADLFKLASFDSSDRVRRIFVYVYGREMRAYYDNLANGMAALIDMPRGGFHLTQTFMTGKSPTFVSKAGQVRDCRVKPLLADEVHNTFRLRAFEVFPD